MCADPLRVGDLPRPGKESSPETGHRAENICRDRLRVPLIYIEVYFPCVLTDLFHPTVRFADAPEIFGDCQILDRQKN